MTGINGLLLSLAVFITAAHASFHLAPVSSDSLESRLKFRLDPGGWYVNSTVDNAAQLSIAASTDLFVSPVHQFDSLDRQSRRRLCRTSAATTNGSAGSPTVDMLFLVLLQCGDIHPCPGPISKYGSSPDPVNLLEFLPFFDIDDGEFGDFQGPDDVSEDCDQQDDSIFDCFTKTF